MIRATASDIEALRAALAVAEARAEEAVAKAVPTTFERSAAAPPKVSGDYCLHI